jgi:formate hydrogenlyase transcriptional activator
VNQIQIPIPANEDRRLAALRDYQILDTPAENDFDELLRLAAQTCKVPIAMITLIDAERQWFKAQIGLECPEMPRHVAFCAHAIMQSDVMVVPDALEDSRFNHNPLVTDFPKIRFYAGAPLITPGGYALGTICVIDHVPRELSPEQARTLQVLSREVVAQLEVRKAKRELAGIAKIEDALRNANQFNREIIEGAGQGIIVYDDQLRYVVFNPFMQRLTGKSAEEVLGKPAVEVFPRLRQSGVEEILRRALSGEIVGAHDLLVPRHSAEGRDVWESCTFAPHLDAEGKIVGVIGLVHDITNRRLEEEIFHNIVIGTATATGADFFPSLVRHLASALHVRYAFVTDCDDQRHARSVAFWKGDGFGDSFEFDIAGTPCENVLHGETCHYATDLQSLFPHDQGLVRWGAESYLGIPMADVDGRIIGHIAILDDKPMERSARAIDLIKIFAARAAAELKRQKAERDLQSALEQVQSLQKKLEAENVYLQEEIRNEHNFDEMVGSSPALLEVLSKIGRIAGTGSTVLIHGETGTGKELVARALHSRSGRKNRPLVKVNCGAIPSGLVESELFGHVKGAFTGALERRTGRFELANGGTLFLDEVGELPLDTQVKLLRVLQEQEFEPVGSGRTIKVDVRIIAASNRDLHEEVKAGRFRSDLFYRLNVLPLTVPPLRERRSDIPALVLFFLARFSKNCGKEIQGVSQNSMELLMRYQWPGNIRELQNVIERGVALCQGQVLQLGPDLLPIERPHLESLDAVTVSKGAADISAGFGLVALEEVEKRHILTVLQKTDGVIDGPKGAARILDLHPNTLRSRMKKLGITRSADESS